MEKEIDCIIHGKVQDVGFRLFAKKEADKLGLVGYVQNEEDGTVSVVAQGEEEGLKEYLEKIKRGPYFSRVDEVEVKYSDRLQDSLMDFEIF